MMFSLYSSLALASIVAHEANAVGVAAQAHSHVDAHVPAFYDGIFAELENDSTENFTEQFS